MAESEPVKHILALDIGGTNPRFGMLRINGPDDYELLVQRRVDKNNSSIIPDLNDFLRECAEKGWTTSVCCAGVAGPIDTKANACNEPTNIHFPVIGDEIIKNTFLKHVLVINDFQAIGEAVAMIDLAKKTKKNEKILSLPAFGVADALSGKPEQHPEPDPSGNRAVIGPGSGLGISYIVKTSEGFHVYASEGGHAGFSTRGNYAPILDYLRETRDIKPVDMESLVSGQGIRYTIEFFLDHPNLFEKMVAEDPELAEAVAGVHTEVTDEQIRREIHRERDGVEDANVARFVAKNANKNPKAHAAMRLFMTFLGSAAQAVALHGLPTGGLFIAGGIPAKNQELLLQGDFMRAFCDAWRPNIRELLSRIPVYLLTDYDISFYGCARVAYKKFLK